MTHISDDLCDVPGILVGHDTNLAAATGCTVIRWTVPMVGSVDVRGGAPATRETDLLDPARMMQEVHAVLLTGGSAFGLDAATGVMRFLEAAHIGYDAGVTRVPIVPAAAIFDLDLATHLVRPDADAGYRAAQQAGTGPVQQGTVGAGTGATVGKMFGRHLAVKGGLGSASATLPDGHVIGVLAVVNAAGDVYDPATGSIVAGARDVSGQGWASGNIPSPDTANSPLGGNTTIAIIATDAAFTKADLNRIAQMAHDGLALAIRPCHTPFDGDAIFAIAQPATRAITPPLQVALAGALAAQTLARAVVKAVQAATGLHGVPSCSEYLAR